MKNIALCFDHASDRTGSNGVTNAVAMMALLHSCDGQLVWSPTDTNLGAASHRFASRRQSLAIHAARTSVVEAYEFLVDRWEPGDRLFLFGSGRGASCARALGRLVGTVGVLGESDLTGWTAEDFREYVLSTYAVPRTRRSASDWARVGQLAVQLCGHGDVAVDVHFLGLWDTVAVVHASVQSYLRAHPSYWRRLPARVEWADPEWEARSERLVSAPSTPAAAPVLVAAS